ncbi:MAG: ABC transporter ATP-binding protein [Pseudomonadota bacterium]
MRQFLRDLKLVLGGDRARVPGVILLMLAAAGLDLLGVGLVLPFIAAAFGEAQATPTLVLGAGLVVAFALRALAGFELQRRLVRFSDRHRASLMATLLDRYLDQPWSFHLTRSQAELTNTLLYEVALYTGNVLNASLRLVADGLVLLLLGGFLLWLQSELAITLALALGCTVLVVNLLTRKPMRRNAERVVQRYEQVVQTLGNSLAALKQARVLGSRELFAQRLAVAARDQAEATAWQNALQTIPRSALEVTLVILMLGAVVWLGQRAESLAAAVATLGAFGVASLRLLPATTSVANQINLLRANRLVLGRLAADLGLPAAAASTASAGAADDPPAVKLRDVSYRYPGAQEDALRGVSLELPAGECVGVIGASGSGKSTLADLLLGLLTPTAGEMVIDGDRLAGDALTWTRRCAYIPQDPCLFNDSLRTNVTLSEATGPELDQRVSKALTQAALADLLHSLPDGLDESLGDHGQRLSGGQRQRLAIARALFFERHFLVFDEATSALDAATEQDIVAAIRLLDGQATVLVVTHREALLSPCHRVYRMAGGTLTPVDHPRRRALA